MLFVITAEKLSNYNSLLEDYDKALIYIQQAIEAFKKNYGTNSDYYVSLQTSLATIYTQLNRIQDAIEIQKDCNDYYIDKHYCPRNSFNISKSNKLIVTHQN